MAKEVSLKIAYSQAPGIRKPSVVKLHQDIKGAGYDFFKNNPEYGPSFLLFASGVRSSQLEEEIMKAPEKGFGEEVVPTLEGLNLRLKTFEEENQSLYHDLTESFPESSVQVEIREFREGAGYVSLKPSADSSNYELSTNPSFGNLSVDIGPAKETAGFALNQVLEPVKKKVAEKVATKAAAALATKAGVEVAAQAVGTSVPVVGNVAAFLATEVVGRITKAIKNIFSSIQRFFKSEDSKELRWLAALSSLFGGIFLLSSGNILFGFPLTTAGGLGALGMLSSSGAGTTVANFGQAVIGGLTTVVLPAIGVPVLIALVTVPVLIAIVLFIINSGAYMVPPSMSTILGQNPYIGIVKEASPSGPFDNSELPGGIRVTYTITITALRGTLTNIVFSHQCQIISERAPRGCPAPLPPSTPTIISPLQEYVYTYTQSYSGLQYLDSLVLNTFSVTADTDEVMGTTAEGSATIIIGDPPTDCYVFEGSWPASYQADMQAAVVYLTSRYSNYVAKVCTGGPLGLRYNPAGAGSYWGMYHGTYIDFFERSFNSRPGINDSIYILAHESGHALANRMSSIYTSYRATPGIFTEVPFCFYSYGTEETERFAEAIAFYAIDPCGNFQSSYPIHYNFVRTNVY